MLRCWGLKLKVEVNGWRCRWIWASISTMTNPCNITMLMHQHVQASSSYILYDSTTTCTFRIGSN